MGEARRRRANDLNYGLSPKLGRGIFLSAPVYYDGDNLKVQSTVNPAELRRAALFWDRLIWPTSDIISIYSNDDEKFLESEGLLLRPKPSGKIYGNSPYRNFAAISSGRNVLGEESPGYISLNGEIGRSFVNQHIEEYFDLEKAEPGQWVLSEGDGSFFLSTNNFVSGRGQLVTLSRAIPLPDPEFPLPELLEFKAKRRDEILSLTFELDRFYSQIASSRDPNFELSRLISVIDRQCSDLIRASQESKWRFFQGDISYSLSIDSFEPMVNRMLGWEMFGLTTTGLPLVGGILGGAASLISFSKGLGAKKLTNRRSPFRVTANMHKELIRK